MITIECNYSKKLGLPQYSSHQFGITLRTELSNLADVQAESARLYTLLQQSVDASIQQTGFLPANTQTMAPAPHNGHRHDLSAGDWLCSAKQRHLILKTASEKGLQDQELQGLSQSQFSKALQQLTRPEASSLISQLLSQRRTGANGDNGHQARTEPEEMA